MRTGLGEEDHVIDNRPWYTYREAARRVNRAVITIKRWRRHGMPMSWDTRGRRIVEHQVLLEWLRASIERDWKNRKKTLDTPIYAEDLLDLW